MKKAMLDEFGSISYAELPDGSIVVWLHRGTTENGFARGHDFTSIAVGTIKATGYLDVADAKRVIDNLQHHHTPTKGGTHMPDDETPDTPPDNEPKPGDQPEQKPEESEAETERTGTTG